MGDDVLDVATVAPQASVDGAVARRGRRRLPAALAVVTALLLGTWFAVSRSREPHDPRAYPGSQAQDLPGTLDRYHLQLPDCARATVRYHRHAQWEADSFYLHFTGDRHCMNQFLLFNGMFLREDAADTAGLPFDARTTAGFGWPQDPARRYRTFRHLRGKAPLVEAQVALHESGDDAEVYLLAGII
ncbi:hypothetical protein [Catellatospora sp. NPDC049609]|uniref:hypothetical protein n=1 Tax=Catellatospora sp. NPDC049609 TaxID=3155505 RepID=UPI003428A3D4